MAATSRIFHSLLRIGLAPTKRTGQGSERLGRSLKREREREREREGLPRQRTSRCEAAKPNVVE
ncbi:protein of unknown function [Pseudorhizobium banfieldiae]|uniref:Uncharacterized protein n=1 Tax=Pseudorhizobium banfieldiae TaxID=1125847 RepID=L0NHT0_9HYPH|nr:protein of unknown function [Pseudorhizobium banfieldiae]